jgi:hypothetical protein
VDEARHKDSRLRQMILRQPPAGAWALEGGGEVWAFVQPAEARLRWEVTNAVQYGEQRLIYEIRSEGDQLLLQADYLPLFSGVVRGEGRNSTLSVNLNFRPAESGDYFISDPFVMTEEGNYRLENFSAVPSGDWGPFNFGFLTPPQPPALRVTGVTFTAVFEVMAGAELYQSEGEALLTIPRSVPLQARLSAQSSTGQTIPLPQGLKVTLNLNTVSGQPAACPAAAPAPKEVGAGEAVEELRFENLRFSTGGQCELALSLELIRTLPPLESAPLVIRNPAALPLARIVAVTNTTYLQVAFLEEAEVGLQLIDVSGSGPHYTIEDRQTTPPLQWPHNRVTIRFGFVDSQGNATEPDFGAASGGVPFELRITDQKEGRDYTRDFQVQDTDLPGVYLVTLEQLPPGD